MIKVAGAAFLLLDQVNRPTFLDGQSDGLAGEVWVALPHWYGLHKLCDHHPRHLGSLLKAHWIEMQFYIHLQHFTFVDLTLIKRSENYWLLKGNTPIKHQRHYDLDCISV